MRVGKAPPICPQGKGKVPLEVQALRGHLRCCLATDGTRHVLCSSSPVSLLIFVSCLQTCFLAFVPPSTDRVTVQGIWAVKPRTLSVLGSTGQVV